MGKTKMECKKLDSLEDAQVCVFCHRSEIDEMKYGPIYMHKNIITHYFCLLLSSNMEQNGRDCDGILGFLPGDIHKEVRRGVRLYCSFCKSGGATLGCAIAKCKVVFHLPCGLKHGTLHQFYGEFKSFCAKHRPVQRISEKILAESSKGAMCGICYEKVVPRPIHETLWAPCCQKNAFFHRDCVQKLAISAGYFFKCPLCNNTNTFLKEMKEYGIYIPEQDASWECVPDAYQELLDRHNTCDHANCSCPSGRKTNNQGTRWELILCKFCGSQGMHIGCGRLKWRCPEFTCDICSGSNNETEQGNARNYNRHRLSGMGRAAEIHPSVSADREAEISDSDDSQGVTISDRHKRVVSPLIESRVKTPTPPNETTPLNFAQKQPSTEFNQAKRPVPTETIVIDDKPDRETPSIVIDDSDDEVEVVSETKKRSCLKSVKTVDGSSIPVVQVKSVQKRLWPMAVGDIKVIPDEIVDISIKMQSHRKKLKSPSPPIQEVVYNLPSTKPSTSTYCPPSTSYTSPDLSRFVLIDSSMMRPDELPANTVLYRSIQQIQSPQVQSQQIQQVVTVPPPQTPVQTQLPTSVPMQQLGSSGNADAKHSNLSQYWPWCRYYLHPEHFKSAAKKSSRSVQCNSVGRRRRARCDNHRLKKALVLLSPLKCRISSSGHFEILVPKRNLSMSFGSMKRKASPLSSKPLKKRKLSQENDLDLKLKPLKRKCTKKKLCDLSDDKLEENKNLKPKKNYRKRKTYDSVTFLNTSRKSSIATFYQPRKVSTENQCGKKLFKGNLTSSPVPLQNNNAPKINFGDSQIPKKKTRKKSISVEEWKYKKIDYYLKMALEQGSIKKQPDVPASTSVGDTNYISMKSVIENVIEHAVGKFESQTINSTTSSFTSLENTDTSSGVIFSRQKKNSISRNNDVGDDAQCSAQNVESLTDNTTRASFSSCESELSFGEMFTNRKEKLNDSVVFKCFTTTSTLVTYDTSFPFVQSSIPQKEKLEKDIVTGSVLSSTSSNPTGILIKCHDVSDCEKFESTVEGRDLYNKSGFPFKVASIGNNTATEIHPEYVKENKDFKEITVDFDNFLTKDKTDGNDAERILLTIGNTSSESQHKYDVMPGIKADKIETITSLRKESTLYTSKTHKDPASSNTLTKIHKVPSLVRPGSGHLNKVNNSAKFVNSFFPKIRIAFPKKSKNKTNIVNDMKVGKNEAKKETPSTYKSHRQKSREINNACHVNKMSVIDYYFTPLKKETNSTNLLSKYLSMESPTKNTPAPPEKDEYKKNVDKTSKNDYSPKKINSPEKRPLAELHMNEIPHITRKL